jgi:hypothetical protein
MAALLSGLKYSDFLPNDAREITFEVIKDKEAG